MKYGSRFGNFFLTASILKSVNPPRIAKVKKMVVAVINPVWCPMNKKELHLKLLQLIFHECILQALGVFYLTRF